MMRITALCLLLAAPAAAQDVAIPKFVEETESAGITATFAGDWEYMVGGGVGVFDCSGDGFPDMLIAGGSGPATFYRNASAKGGALSFRPEQSGLEIDKVSGAYPMDVDGDGITDLVLLRVGENLVMRGLGDCRFERANEAWGLDGGDAWTASFAATWEKGADWPTLAFGNYIDRTQDIPWGSCTDNWLIRPAEGERRFGPPIPLKPSFCALSMLFTDWDRSGTPSLRVSNDREYYKGGQEQMWHVRPGEAPALYTPAEGWKPLRIWGMGIASYDLNFDGYPEYYLTSMADNKLQTLANPPKDGEAQATFADVAFPKKVIAQRPYIGGEIRPSTAWHAQFEDVNNDGLTDLFVAKGNVDQMPDFAQKDPNNLMLQLADGTFQEVGDKAGIASMKTSRGGAVVDFNLDGLLDLVVVNRREPAQVWRNVSDNAGNWIQLRLRQPGPNADAVGAWIEVKCGDTILRREAMVGGGHASGELGWRHFGLGGAKDAQVRVIWPDGTEGEWQPVTAGSFYVIEPGKPVQPWQPG
ncbi:MAG: hypothetical protein DI533_04285 [Cereibacter sphaeroides]|uniref:ASPIC/UnbV domain-containing protein n=1 Tax=Cereibacter sphaeroides TaxID=1063 RepID=A0A2W5SGD2_CERSP|nr:MAG: hypothetical protein DI533_04285 [Cereibacter sphaeroides]